MQLVYFASVRESLGQDREVCELPENVQTVAQCLDWLVERSDAHKAAFSDHTKLRFALDQTIVRLDSKISNASELAIFPPVTGG